MNNHRIEIFHRPWNNADGSPISPLPKGKVVKRIQGHDLDALKAEARRLCRKFDGDVYIRGNPSTRSQWEKVNRKHEWRSV